MVETEKMKQSDIPKILLPFLPEHPIIGHPYFLTPAPRLHRLKNGLAITLDMLVFRDSRGYIWTVPAGFLTDGASIPWFLRWLWSPWDEKTLRPAIIHDLRYSLYDYFFEWPNFDNRHAADNGLYEGMKLDCPRRAGKYRFAVSMFGRSVYEHKDENATMLEWFDVLRKDNVPELNKWIQEKIETDEAA